MNVQKREREGERWSACWTYRNIVILHSNFVCLIITNYWIPNGHIILSFSRWIFCIFVRISRSLSCSFCLSIGCGRMICTMNFSFLLHRINSLFLFTYFMVVLFCLISCLFAVGCRCRCLFAVFSMPLFNWQHVQS